MTGRYGGRSFSAQGVARFDMTPFSAAMPSDPSKIRSHDCRGSMSYLIARQSEPRQS